MGRNTATGTRLTLPNIITIARLCGVPVLVWALIEGDWTLAFAIFVVAGISDAVDGALARRLNQQSELGLYLDPIADKVLLVSVFVGLALLGRLPDWLAIAVVGRDLLIVGAVLLSSSWDGRSRCGRCSSPSSIPCRRSCWPAWRSASRPSVCR